MAKGSSLILRRHYLSEHIEIISELFSMSGIEFCILFMVSDVAESAYYARNFLNSAASLLKDNKISTTFIFTANCEKDFFDFPIMQEKDISDILEILSIRKIMSPNLPDDILNLLKNSKPDMPCKILNDKNYPIVTRMFMKKPISLWDSFAKELLG